MLYDKFHIGSLDIAILIAMVATIIAISVLRPFATSINLTDSPIIEKNMKALCH